MFNARLFGLAAGVFTLSAALIGCSGTTDDDDATGDDDASGEVTPTPVPPPQMSFTTSDVTATCSGTDLTDSDWAFSINMTGWSLDNPTVEIYDDYDVPYYDHDPAKAYNELAHFDLTTKEGDDTTAYYELWDKTLVADTLANYQEDATTVFQCQNKSGLTFIYCAQDYFYNTAELCVGIGKWVDTYCPDCQ